MVAVVASFTVGGSKLRQRRSGGMVEASFDFIPWIAATMARHWRAPVAGIAPVADDAGVLQFAWGLSVVAESQLLLQQARSCE